MSLVSMASGFLTASISSISILILVYLRLEDEIEDLKDKGDWADNDRDNPEYNIAVNLKRSIYLGTAAGILTVIAMLIKMNIRPTLQFELDVTLVVIAGILIILEIFAILWGTKYLGD